ncbi:hypothetical protein [Cellulomonas marina]|uniref:hypothetical protein n=1 Tax=Cellulomonas marina TaxID=988821 RepID=UPI000B7ECA14|nr:hypothetical protein [Cellulomonas marina]
MARALPAAGFAVLALAGCTATNPVTTNVSYDPSDGIGVTVGTVYAQNLLVLTTAEGEPGVLVGAFTNESSDAVDVSLELPGGESDSLDLAAAEAVYLGTEDDEGIAIDTVPAAPGGLVDVTMSTPEGGSQTVRVPVLDGTLPEYATLVPTPPGSTVSPSATPAPSGSAGAGNEEGEEGEEEG